MCDRCLRMLLFHSGASSPCFRMALDTSRQLSHTRFFTSVLVCSSCRILTTTFAEGFTYTTFTWSPVCGKSSTFSLLNISSPFSDEGLLSPVNARDFRNFLSGLICDGVLTSGELTRTSFVSPWWTRFLWSCKRMFCTFYRCTAYCWKSCDFHKLKQMTKTDNFATTGVAYTIRENFWILRQNQSLTTNVYKHNSKGIFPLRQFKNILRREVKLFTGEAPKLQFKTTITNPAAVTRTCFRHNLTRALLARFSKTCQIYVYDVVVGSKFLVSGKKRIRIFIGCLYISGKAIKRK